MSYYRLPELAQASEPETAQQTGLRVLAFVLTTGVTATLSEEQLRLADHVFPVAVSGPELSPLAAERLAGVRTLVCDALRRRMALEAAQAPVGEPAGMDKPQAGPGAKLQPTPRQSPPAGSLEVPPIAPAPVAVPRQPAARPVRPVSVPVPTRDAFAF